MATYAYTDIALDDNFQPMTQANGDFALVEGLDCLTQEIKIEALTTAGELFYDKDFGWSLPDFQQAQSDDLTLLELQQRVRAKLASRQEIDTSSIAVTVTTGDTVRLLIVWRYVGATKNTQLDISIGRVEIEVITVD
ncbi:MAG TPA: DUF2634 domain-containing protein [Clostridia bacterium]|nr:DUF2634 domain-containing protein [Clostridia bacterium]